MNRTNVLIVEDESIVALGLKRDLINLGYSVSDIVSSGEEAVVKAEEHQPDLVLMDIKLSGEMDGIESAELIRKKFMIPIIYLTAYADDDTLQRAKFTEPFGYILKPYEQRSLQSTIEMGLYKSKIEREMCVKNAAIESSLSGIALGTLDGHINYVNKSFLRMWRYEDASKIIDKSVESLWNFDTTSDQFFTALKKQNTWNGVAYAQRPDGSCFTGQISFQTVVDDSGNAICWMLTCMDITKRKELEEESVKTKNYLQNLLDSASELIVSIDENFRITTWNKTAERITDFKKNEVLGKKVGYLNIFNDGDEIKRIIQEMGVEKDTSLKELSITTKKGVKRILNVSFSSIKGSKKNAGIVVIGKDITHEIEVHKKITNGRSYFISKNVEGKKAIVSKLVDLGYGVLGFVRPQSYFFDFLNMSFDANLNLISKNDSQEVNRVNDFESISTKIFDFCQTHQNPLIILDGIHYFLINYSFDYVAKFFLEVNELISDTNAILLVLTDESLFDEQQLSLLKQELYSLPDKDITDVYIDDKVGRLLKFIYDQNQNNASVSFKKVMSEFDIVYATAAKRINVLEENQLISVKNSGKAKRMFVSEKGKNFLDNMSSI